MRRIWSTEALVLWTGPAPSTLPYQILRSVYYIGHSQFMDVSSGLFSVKSDYSMKVCRTLNQKKLKARDKYHYHFSAKWFFTHKIIGFQHSLRIIRFLSLLLRGLRWWIVLDGITVMSSNSAFCRLVFFFLRPELYTFILVFIRWTKRKLRVEHFWVFQATKRKWSLECLCSLPILSVTQVNAFSWILNL